MKQKIVIFITAVLLFSCADNYKKAEEYTLKGYELLNNDIKKALFLFDKAIKVKEDFIKAYEGKAICYKKLNNRELLKETLIKIIKLNKTNDFATSELAKIYFEESNYEDAFSILKDADIEKNKDLFNEILAILIRNEVKKPILSLNYKKLLEYYTFQNREKEGDGKKASAIFMILDYIEKKSKESNDKKIFNEIMKYLESEIESIKPILEVNSFEYVQKGYEMAESHGNNLFESEKQMYEEFLKMLKRVYAFYYLEEIKIDEKEEVKHAIVRSKIFYYYALKKKFEKVKSSFK